ncbi:hypothetical protein QBC43DRAFT_325210 [Cladorrhinum sp. PSN259]|nr:hypothetical protein QBC43DRAFT_325210 [Cladorrhinum sp. PSN259]
MSDPISRLPSHLQANGYTNELRSSSRMSWDGQRPSPRPRSISRPQSCGSLIGQTLSESPAPAQCRWSYDLVRMPHSQTRTTNQIPQSHVPPSATTPEEIQQIFPWLPSRPQSSCSNGSPQPSRPTSMVRFEDDLKDQSPTTTVHHLNGRSTPTLWVTPPDVRSEPSRWEVPTCELDSSDMEKPRSTTDNPLKSKERKKTKTNQQAKVIKDIDEPADACCFGLCRKGKVRSVGGKVTAWLIGTILPITWGVVMGVMKGFTGGR